MTKCKWCGKEFEKVQKNHIYCSKECRKENFNAGISLRRAIWRIKELNNLQVSNVSRIVNAKLMLFKKDFMRCPCAGNDPERFCGSEKCMKEIKETGQCHCGLFKKKEPKNE